MKEEKVYKYTSILRAIDIIHNNHVFMSAPQNFNDPFDCIVKENDDSLNNAFNFGFRYIILKEFCLRYFDKSFYDKDLILLQNKARRILSSCKNDYLQYGKTISIDDNLFKNAYNTLPLNNRLHYDLLNEVNKNQIVKSVDQFLSNLRISCFSKRNDSILMWSHYGCSHQGVCIEYTRTKAMEDVIYTDNLADIDFLKFTKLIVTEKESKLQHEMFEQKYAECVIKPLLNKSDDWSYEQEVRVIFDIKDPNQYDDINLSIDGNYFYNPGVPTTIYLGCNIKKSKELDLLVQMAKKRNIPIKFMKRSPDKFKIIVDENKQYKPMEIDDGEVTYLSIVTSQLKHLADTKNTDLLLLYELLLINIFSTIVYDAESKDNYVKWIKTYLGGFYVDDAEIIFDLFSTYKKTGSFQLKGSYNGTTISNIKIEEQGNDNFNLFINTEIRHKNQNDFTFIINPIKLYYSLSDALNKCYQNNKVKFDNIYFAEYYDVDLERFNLTEIIHPKKIGKNPKYK